MAGTILETIAATKREEVAAARAKCSIDEMRRRARDAPPTRDFLGALTLPPGGTGASARPGETIPTLSRGGIRWIGEIKRRSPSAGLIRAGFDPAGLARTYAASGAAALSVLTDRRYFEGDSSHLAEARAAVGLPVLRKDFIIDEYQVHEARAIGADAVLLIARILPPDRIEAWSAAADAWHMASLIEIHNEVELDSVRRCLRDGRRVILGINNRDLERQVTDLATTERLARLLPTGTPFIAESGIGSRQDVARMHTAGATALLIGEAFMRAGDLAEKARELFG